MDRVVELGTDVDEYLARIQLVDYPDIVVMNQTVVDVVQSTQLGLQRRRFRMIGTDSDGLTASSLLFNFTIVDTTAPVRVYLVLVLPSLLHYADISSFSSYPGHLD
jgi:hypothetical protein